MNICLCIYVKIFSFADYKSRNMKELVSKLKSSERVQVICQ